MTRLLLRCSLAAILAAPLALGVHAQNAPAQEPAPAPPAAPAPAAPQTPNQPPSPTFRGGINFVRVDVIVTDRQGNNVADLRQEDFEVFEDDKPQTIETFKLISVSETYDTSEPVKQIRTPIDEQSEAARDDVRVFGVFLDDYHVRLENSMRAREVIARFVETQLRPTDMIALMYPLTPLSDVMLTRDHKNVASALRQFQGRKYDYTPRNAFEERYVNHVSTIEAERIRNQVSMSAIKALIMHLGGLRDGRKSMIMVSEGFTNSLPSQMQDPIAACPRCPAPGEITRRPARPDPAPGTAAAQRMDSIEFFQQSEILGDLRWIYQAANRYNTTIYAVDPRGLAPFEFDLSRANISMTKDRNVLDNSLDTLRILAENTDGRAIVNQNNLEPGLRQILRDSSGYYLLGYASTNTVPDGKFHEIKVRVKRPNVQIRARRGYLALTPTEAERVLAPPKAGPPRAVTEALNTLAPAQRAMIRSWVGMSPGADGKTKVTFVWSPAPPRPGVRAETAASISLVAGNAGSDLFYRAKTMAPGRVEFEVPPGPMELEISVQNAAAELLDREVRKVVVPAMGVGLTLSTPQVFRARTAREWTTLAADPAAVPATEREFRRVERLLIRVGAQSAAGTPAVTARLLNREGGEMATLPVTPAGFGALHHIDVPLAGLPAGEFLVEIKASDGGEDATSLVPIRVGA